MWDQMRKSIPSKADFAGHTFCYKRRKMGILSRAAACIENTALYLETHGAYRPTKSRRTSD
jgi:hypothetical protein